jgi:DNA-binding transcriptional regulator YiaG
MTAKQFRTARARLGLTQQALAGRLGVHVQTVKKWSSGDRRIPQPVAILVRLWLTADHQSATRRLS